MYRRGRWAHGAALSVGVIPNGVTASRIGLRVRRGVKRATDRNRLKRQLRTIIYGPEFCVKDGVDLVVVIHPRTLPTATTALKAELEQLCKRQKILS